LNRILSKLVHSFEEAKTRAKGVAVASVLYLTISIYFFFGLLTSEGDVAQQDWGTPLTASAAMNNAHSILFSWNYQGFGGPALSLGFPYFTILNAMLAPMGFYGGTEVKTMPLFLVALAGVSIFLLLRSFGLGFYSSFFAGVFFMTTPIVFDWVMFGWLNYLIPYALFPLIILATMKFLETNKLRYVLLTGLLFSLAFSMQIAYILVYPISLIIFSLFEGKANFRIFLRGFECAVLSTAIWSMTVLGEFAAITSSTISSYYHGEYFLIILNEFSRLRTFLNPLRLWGSTVNFQFESFFPKQLTVLSFMPLAIGSVSLLLWPRHKRILFSFVMYLFTFLAYLASVYLYYLVFDISFGEIFEAPSIFLAPAALGLGVLMGYVGESLIHVPIFTSKQYASRLGAILLLILLVLTAIPWWSGQTSGAPLSGVESKLNLYKVPEGYKDWSSSPAVENSTNEEYFVLYVPIPLPTSSDVFISNTSYFSTGYAGVSVAIFTESNNLPYISITNDSVFVNDLINSSFTNSAVLLGSYSIKYIVVYTNVQGSLNTSQFMNRLSEITGITQVEKLPDVVVYRDNYAKPVIYSNSSGVSTKINYQDPTDYQVSANSATNSSYLLVFNQEFSVDWIASVNGKPIPQEDHIDLDSGLNGWYINQTGAVTLDIRYALQTQYWWSLIISASLIVCTSIFLIAVFSIDALRIGSGFRNK